MVYGLSVFYTFEQFDPHERPLIKERLVCVQGDSLEEINQRAEWFGIDFESEGPNGYYQWQRANRASMTRYPMFGRTRLETIEWDWWIVVYEDGNLRCNSSVPFSDEPDMSFLNPDFDLDP